MYSDRHNTNGNKIREHGLVMPNSNVQYHPKIVYKLLMVDLYLYL